MAFVPGSIASQYKTGATPTTGGFVPGSIASKISTSAPATTGFVPGSISSKYNTSKQDLTTSQGLLNVARNTGGAVATNAEQITGNNPSFFGQLGTALKTGLSKVLDYAQRFNYASASAVKNVIDKDPNTTFMGGLYTGITGQTKFTYSDVLGEAGFNPTSTAGKIGKGLAGFALDVLLDPTTYITFGESAGAKVMVGGVERALSKTGTEFAAKALATESGKLFGQEFVTKAMANMAEKSPELYGKFLDQGGVKFFGQTLVSSARIAAVAKTIPGMSKLDELSKPTRDALYALFHRDASAKFGKLPSEYIRLQQTFRDLGHVRGASAINKATDIAIANKLTSQEAELISNAIEVGLPLADNRLENARQLISQQLGRNLAAEQRAGLEVGQRQNYVFHALVDQEVGNIPFKPTGVNVSLGASNSREIQKFVASDGSTVIGKASVHKMTPLEPIKGLSHDLNYGEYKSITDIKDTLKKYGTDLIFKPQNYVSKRGVGGYFDPVAKKIVIASERPTLDEVMRVVIHEVTHNAHFQAGGDIQMFENFTKKGGSANLAKALDAAKTAARQESQQIIAHHGVNFDLLNPAGKQYYRKPTELLAYAIQEYRKNPEAAMKAFPATITAIKDMGEQKFSNSLLRSITKPFEKDATMLTGGEFFTNEAGKLFKSSVDNGATIEEINNAFGKMDPTSPNFGKNFFDPNIINSTAIRNVQSARAVTAKEFLTEVAQKFGAKVGEAPTNYVESGVKELAGLSFHPAIAEQLTKFHSALVNDDATNKLLKQFDKLQNFWKASVTSIFPAFHGRNAISNVFLNFLDLGAAAISPAKHILSVSLLMNDKVANKLERAVLEGGEVAKAAKVELKALFEKPVLTDRLGKTWTFGELRNEIKNRRIAFGDEFTGYLDIRQSNEAKMKAVQGSTLKQKAGKLNPFSQDNIAFSTGRAVGNQIEQQARVLNFITNLEKTGDVLTSAERTKQFLFDYTNLSDFEKNVMRRLIPFYTFTRKNLELQAVQSLKQPGKLATQAKLFSGISSVLSGGQITDEERKSLPEFLQQGLGIVVSRKGSKLQIIDQIGTPIEQVFSAIQPNVILGGMSPVIAVPLQVAIGKHFFFDKDLSKVNDATAYQHAPQFLKDYIGFTVRKNQDGTNRYVSLNPTRMFLINNIPPFSRDIAVVGQLEAANVSGKLKVWRQLTGLKPYGEDLDLQAQLIEKQKVRDLQDLLDTSGVAPVFRRSFIPKN